MTATDEAFWRAQLIGVTPLKGRRRENRSTLTRVVKKPPALPAAPPRSEHTIDLHGMTLAEAHHAISREIKRCAANDVRRLHIVTGKGRAGSRATIKSELKHWMDARDLAPLIVSVKPAPRERGGDGAVDVQIRRRDKVAK